MRVELTSENKSKDTTGYPRFRLEKDERARFCIIEPTPQMRRVHALRMPVVENGRIVMEKKKGQRGEYEAVVTEFVGQHMCTGDEAFFDSHPGKFTDSANCKMCQFVEEHPDYFDAPYRRFAQHILQYKTQPGTAKVATPFQAELKLWLYTDARFDALVDMIEEHGGPSKSPRVFDIIAGPCESKQWQRYPIQAGGKCEWAATPERQALVKEIWANNQCEDVEDQIARKPNAAFLQADVDKVLDRWAEVGVTRDDEGPTGADTDDLNALLGFGDEVRAAKKSTTPEPDVSALDALDAVSPVAEDVVPDLDVPDLDVPAVEEPKKPKAKKEKAPEPAPAPAADEVADFDDLLGSMLGG